jgi:predicted nucleic acid-binding protein
MKGIADTGFIVAACNQDDTYHAWALRIARAVTEPLLTCESVLAEAAFQLKSSSYVLALVEDELLKVAFDLSRNLREVRELARRYSDRNPDLADLCLVRMSELYPRHTSLSAQQARSHSAALPSKGHVKAWDPESESNRIKFPL